MNLERLRRKFTKHPLVTCIEKDYTSYIEFILENAPKEWLIEKRRTLSPLVVALRNPEAMWIVERLALRCGENEVLNNCKYGAFNSPIYIALVHDNVPGLRYLSRYNSNVSVPIPNEAKDSTILEMILNGTIRLDLSDLLQNREKIVLKLLEDHFELLEERDIEYDVSNLERFVAYIRNPSILERWMRRLNADPNRYYSDRYKYCCCHVHRKMMCQKCESTELTTLFMRYCHYRIVGYATGMLHMFVKLGGNPCYCPPRCMSWIPMFDQKICKELWRYIPNPLPLPHLVKNLEGCCGTPRIYRNVIGYERCSNCGATIFDENHLYIHYVNFYKLLIVMKSIDSNYSLYDLNMCRDFLKRKMVVFRRELKF